MVTAGAPSPRKSVLLNYDTAHNINGPKLINGSGDAALRSADGMKLLVGDPGPPDVWSHQVSARNPSGNQVRHRNQRGARGGGVMSRPQPRLTALCHRRSWHHDDSRTRERRVWG